MPKKNCLECTLKPLFWVITLAYGVLKHYGKEICKRPLKPCALPLPNKLQVLLIGIPTAERMAVFE